VIFKSGKCRLANCMSVLTTVFSLTQFANAASLNVPLPNSPISPKYSIPTTTVKLASARITGVMPQCLKSPEKFVISGQNFVSSKNKSVVLDGNKLHMALGIISWSNASIELKIPSPGQLQRGAIYTVTIMDSAGTAKLSNTFSGIRLCAQVQTTATATGSGGSGSFAGEPAEYEPAAGMMTSQPGNSLDGMKLPDPPKVPVTDSAADNDIEPHELLVISANLQEAESLRKSLAGMNIRVIRRTKLQALGLVLNVLKLPEEITVQDGLGKLRKKYSSTWIDSNRRYHLQGSPTNWDPKRFSYAMINWQGHKACSGSQRIGIIDSTADLKHPALVHQYVRQKLFLPSGVKLAAQEHGTAITALLVGNDPGRKLVGLLKDAKIYIAGVFRQNRDGEAETTSELIVRGLDWLKSQHVSTINLSLGGKRNLVLEAAIKRLLDSGMAIAAAAGNAGPAAPAVYPAAQNGVVAVTAVDAASDIYPGSNQGDYVAIAAPGVDVWSAAPGSRGRFYTGTSYAVPFVSAYLSLRGNNTLAEVERQMEKSAVDLGSRGRDEVFGWGLLQASLNCKGETHAK